MGRMHLGLLRDEPEEKWRRRLRASLRLTKDIRAVINNLPILRRDREPRYTALINWFIEQCRNFDIQTSPGRFLPDLGYLGNLQMLCAADIALKGRYSGAVFRRMLLNLYTSRTPPNRPSSVEASTEHPARKTLVADVKLLGPLPGRNRAERRAAQKLARKRCT